MHVVHLYYRMFLNWICLLNNDLASYILLDDKHKTVLGFSHEINQIQTQILAKITEVTQKH